MQILFTFSNFLQVLFEVEEMQKMQALIKPHKDPRNPRAIPNVLYHSKAAPPLIDLHIDCYKDYPSG